LEEYGTGTFSIRIQQANPSKWEALLGAESILMQMHGHVFVEILPVGFGPLVGEPPKKKFAVQLG